MTKLADLIATGINASLLTACQLTGQARQTGAQSPIHEQIRAVLDSVNRGILGQLNAGIPMDVASLGHRDLKPDNIEGGSPGDPSPAGIETWVG